MTVLAIAGGILLAFLLLPVLGPALGIALILAIVGTLVVLNVNAIVTFVDDVKASKEKQKQEDERLAKLTEQERNAEIQKKKNSGARNCAFVYLHLSSPLLLFS